MSLTSRILSYHLYKSQISLHKEMQSISYDGWKPNKKGFIDIYRYIYINFSFHNNCLYKSINHVICLSWIGEGIIFTLNIYIYNLIRLSIYIYVRYSHVQYSQTRLCRTSLGKRNIQLFPKTGSHFIQPGLDGTQHDL